MLVVALPQVRLALGLTNSELALVTSAYGVSFAGLLLLGGRLADLYGGRLLLVTGLVLFAVASAGCAVAPTAYTLVAARFAQGVGAALASPAAMALVSSVVTEPALRVRALALWGVLSGTGATLGALLSGLFAHNESWRGIFAVLVAVALLCLVGTFRFVPAPPPVGAGRLDIPGAVLGTTGLTATGYGIIEVAPVALAVGAVSLVAFVLVQARSSQPLVPLGLLATRPRAVALGSIVLASAAMAGGFFFLSLYFQDERGASALATASLFLLFGLALTATGLLAGRLVSRYDVRPVLTAGLVIGAAGLLLLAPLGTTVLAGLVVMPVGVGLVFSSATVLAARDSPARLSGVVAAVATTAMEVGPTVGFALLVALASAAGGYGPALTGAALLFLLLTPAALTLRRTTRTPLRETSSDQ
ncbi:putative transmembrane efflux protein [Nocardiopsis sp. JB363]|nr:putative transmembrane efflux protein [Nocardiopsis sp. JB363]